LTDALAIAVPSKVDVPRPSSSIMTRLRRVAPRKAAAVSANCKFRKRNEVVVHKKRCGLSNKWRSTDIIVPQRKK
jgi:hypothetical protein